MSVAKRDLVGERIIRDPKICGGQPVFKGTRVTLRTVLASLAEGDSPETILAAFPTLSPEDVRAAIRVCGGLGGGRSARPGCAPPLMKIRGFFSPERGDRSQPRPSAWVRRIQQMRKP